MNASVDTPYPATAAKARPRPSAPADHDGPVLARSLRRAEAAVRGRTSGNPSFNSAI